MTSETSNDHFRLCLVLSQMLLVPLLTLAQGPIAIPPERLPFGVPFQVLSTLVPETAFWFLVFHFSVAEGDTVRRCKEICCGKDLLFTPLSLLPAPGCSSHLPLDGGTLCGKVTLSPVLRWMRRLETKQLTRNRE